MANQKISQLTEQTDLSLIDGLAGYEGTSNVRISGPNIISAIPTLYTNDGSINEDRVITVGHDPTTKVTYNTSFESSKANNTTTRNSAGNIVQIKETYTSQIPVSYAQTRGAVLKLQATNSSGSVNTESYIHSFIINSGSSDYTSREQMGFRTNKAFVFKPTDTSWPIYFAIKGGPNNNPRSMIYSPGDGGLLQLSAGNAKTTKITIADTSSTGTSNGYYRYIDGGNTGNLVLGRKLSGGNEEPYITCSGVGGYGGDIAVGINQGTPAATLHVTGSGSTNATTSLLVQDSLGNEIIKALDDQTIRLGYNGNQITTSTASSGTVDLNNNSGSTIFRAGVVSGSTGKINVLQGGWRSFEYAANQGLALTNQTGFHISQDASSMLTCVSQTKGMLPPRMTTAQKNAIASPANGLVLFDTDENNLQYYNGAWNPTGLTPNSQLLAMTEITATATGNVTHDIHNFSNTPSNNLTAVNFDSDGTNRYAKIVFTPTYSGKAKIVFTSYTNIVGGSNDISVGLHDRATSTTTPVYGWFMVVEDDEPASLRILKAEWIVDVFEDEQFVGYVQAIANGSGNEFVAGNYQGAAWSSSNKYAGPALVEAYSIENISITTNPTG